MLAFPGRSELRRRLPRLLFGLVICGVALGLMVQADLGLGPWDVLHQGISEHIGVPIGTVSIMTGAAVLALWYPLRERIGIGTVLNVIVIGATMDIVIALVPAPGPLPLRVAAMAAGPLLFGLGSGFYIGAGLGPGPRDGVMTGIARRGWPISGVRTAIEAVVLAGGFVLGGTVGVGTLAFAFGIGPLVGFFLPRLSLPPVAAVFKG